MADMRRALSRSDKHVYMSDGIVWRATCHPRLGGALGEGGGRRNTIPSDYKLNVLAELRLDIFNTLSKLLLADKSNDIGNAKSA